jgi:hypothetical protein
MIINDGRYCNSAENGSICPPYDANGAVYRNSIPASKFPADPLEYLQPGHIEELK